MILKKLKFFKAAALLSFAAAGALLFAQEKSDPTDPKSAFADFDLLPQSKTNEATQKTFRSDVDNYMRPDYWQTVDFSKAFGFLGYGGSDRPIDAGFATKFGPVFLGAYYTGNIAKFGNADVEKTVDTKYVENPDGSFDVESTTTTKTVEGNPFTESNNGLFVLIGLKNMGFKLGVVENLKTSSEFQLDNLVPSPEYHYISKVTNNADGSSTSQKLEDLSYIFGDLAPSVQWAMSLPLGSMKLTPSVHALVNFGNGFEYDDHDFATVSGKYKELEKDLQGNVIKDKVIDFKSKAGYINPAFKVGAELALNSAMTVELHYAIGFNVYDDDHGVTITDDTKSPIQTGADTTNTNTKTYFGYKYNSDIGHYIEPAFKYTKNVSDNFTLKSKILVGLGFSSYDRDSQYNKTVTTRYNTADPKDSYTVIEMTDGNNSLPNDKLSKFTLTPSIALGAQYKAIPDRLTVNAGVSLNPFSYITSTEKTKPNGQTVRTTTKYDNGRYVPDTIKYDYPDPWEDTTTVSNYFDSASISLGAGFTFNFTPGFAVDLAFNTTGFTLDMSQASVLFSIKGAPSTEE